MKKQILCCFGALLLAACTPKTYTICGSIAETADGDTVFLASENKWQYVYEDTAIVIDGQFQFAGSTEFASLCYIIAKHSGIEIDPIPFILENSPIKIEKSGSELTIEGDINNRIWQEFYGTPIMEFEQEYRNIQESIKDSSLSVEEHVAARLKLDSMERANVRFHKKLIEDNMPNDICDIFLYYLSYEYTGRELIELMEKFEVQMPDHPNYKALKAEIEAQASVALDREYTDIELMSPEGETIKLSDYVGKSKLVLVDFWASWCAPCCEEMSNVADVYAEYKDKGLEIIGVSLDKDKTQWTNSLQKMNMTWPQMSDLQGWKSQAAELYHVHQIPNNVLIDANGIIIEKGLCGYKLRDAISEILQ